MSQSSLEYIWGTWSFLLVRPSSPEHHSLVMSHPSSLILTLLVRLTDAQVREVRQMGDTWPMQGWGLKRRSDTWPVQVWDLTRGGVTSDWEEWQHLYVFYNPDLMSASFNKSFCCVWEVVKFQLNTFLKQYFCFQISFAAVYFLCLPLSPLAKNTTTWVWHDRPNGQMVFGSGCVGAKLPSERPQILVIYGDITVPGLTHIKTFLKILLNN